MTCIAVPSPQTPSWTSIASSVMVLPWTQSSAIPAPPWSVRNADILVTKTTEAVNAWRNVDRIRVMKNWVNRSKEFTNHWSSDARMRAARSAFPYESIVRISPRSAKSRSSDGHCLLFKLIPYPKKIKTCIQLMMMIWATPSRIALNLAIFVTYLMMGQMKINRQLWKLREDHLLCTKGKRQLAIQTMMVDIRSTTQATKITKDQYSTKISSMSKGICKA